MAQKKTAFFSKTVTMLDSQGENIRLDRFRRNISSRQADSQFLRPSVMGESYFRSDCCQC
ncbi:MAG: hypothetical protein WCV67_16860 [Victivallaceae bacterium]